MQRARTIPAAAMGGLMAMALAGCAGGPSGTYIGEDRQGHFATVVVDGTSVTYTEPQCDGEGNDTSVGEMDENRSLVVWLEPGRWTGDDALTFTDTTVSFSSDGDGDPYEAVVFVRDTTPEGQALAQAHAEDCSAQ